MMNDWEVKEIDEVCDEIIDCINKTAPKVDYETEFKMLRTTNVRDGWVTTKDVKYVEKDIYRKWIRRGKPKKGDVILTREAPLGEVGMLKTNEKVFLGQRLVMYRANPEKLDNRFLLYSMQDRFMQSQISAYGSGSTVEHMRVPHCKQLEIRLPSLETQRTIGSVLAAFDDLIENNTRRIEILEEIARLIYREWFVYYRHPGHEKDKLVDSGTDLGEIPEGWEVKKLEDTLEHYIGGGWGKEEQMKKYPDPAYVIRGTDIPGATKGDISDVPFRYHKVSNLKSRKLKDGDIVFEVSGGSKGQPLGRSLLITDTLLSEFDSEVMCASFCKLMRVNQEITIPELLYLEILEMYDDRRIMKYQVQSTGISNFKFSFFLEDLGVLIPPKRLQNEFAEKVRPLFKEMHLLGKKNARLKSTRDLLLPKLISGKVVL